MNLPFSDFIVSAWGAITMHSQHTIDKFLLKQLQHILWTFATEAEVPANSKHPVDGNDLATNQVEKRIISYIIITFNCRHLQQEQL